MAVRAVIVTDGKRGHENQSRVVARMFGDTAPLMMQLRDGVKEGGIAEWMLRTRMRFAGGRRLALEPAARAVRKYLVPEDTQAFRDFATEVHSGGIGRTVVVSTGTPPATFNLIVSDMLGAVSVVVMTPSMLPRELFGLNIVPAHDWRGGEPPVNVIVNALALAYFDEPAAEHLALQLLREHDLSRAFTYWGLALGGPSRSVPWHQEHLLGQLESVLNSAGQTGAKLLVTTSRRTPEWCTAWLANRQAEGTAVTYLLNASKDPLNPLPAFYALCNRMLVTADSFSMVSEAINAGFRAELLTTSPTAGSGKLARSLGYLREQGMAVAFGGAVVQGSGDAAAFRPWKHNWHYEELRNAVLLKLGL